MSKKNSSSNSKMARFIVLVFLILLAGAFLMKDKIGGMFAPGTTQVMGVIMEGFPEFPIYPGVNIKSSQKTGAYGSEPVSYQAYLESAESADTIVEWYKSELEKEGWSLSPESTTEQPDAQYLYLTRKNQKATVFVETEEGGSFVSVHIQ